MYLSLNMGEKGVSGYLLEYYQYIRYTEWSKKMLEGYIKNRPSDDKAFLTFGEFDRLKIRKVVEFSRFRDVSEMSRRWAGKRTQILLYDIENDPEIIFNEEKEKFVIKKDQTSKRKLISPLFLGVTIMPIEDSVRRNQKKTYSNIVSECKEQLHSVIRELKKENTTHFEVFGTLGTYGIAIVWLTDQYVDVLEILNNLLKKQDQDKLYFALSTLFSENLQENEFEKAKEKIDNIKGCARVRITTNKDKDSFIRKLKSLEGKKIYRCAGKYDFIMDVSAKEIYTMFNKNGAFYYKTLAEQDVLLQTEVNLIEDTSAKEGIVKEETGNVQTAKEETIDNEDCNKENETKKYLEMLEDIEIKYKNLRKWYKEHFPSEAGMVDTLDLLYCDYFSNISASLNDIWAEDLSYQFLKTLNCLDELCSCYKDGRIDNDSYIDWVCSIMNSFKQQVFHIAESNKLYLDIPKCYLRYTGQQDVILYAWFGIIKRILKSIYELKSENLQSEIIPVITIDAIPVMRGRLYFEKGGTSSTRILNLYLPGSVLYDIPKHIPTVINELFHYAVPWNRFERNIYYGVIYVQEYVKNVISIWINKKIKIILGDEYNACGNQKWVIAQFIDRLNPYIFSYLTNTYQGQIHTAVVYAGNNGTEEDEIHCCRNYISALWSYMTGRKEDELTCTDETREMLFENWFQGLFDVLLKKRIEIEKQFEEGIHIENVDNELERKQIRVIIDKVKNIFFSCLNDEKKMFRELQTESVEIPNQNRFLVFGMRKAAADIAMVEMTGMDIFSYLVYYTMDRSEKNIDPDQYNSAAEVEEELRLGMVLEYFLRNNRNLQLEDEKFETEFIGRYIAQRLTQKELNITEDKIDHEVWKNVLEKVKEDRIKAEKWCGIYKNVYKNYHKFYGIYKGIMEKLEDHARLSNRNVFNTMAEALIDYFNVCELQNALDSLDGSKEKKQKLIDAWKNRVTVLFDINCKLIYDNQSQVTLKKIYESYNLLKEQEKINSVKKERKAIPFWKIEFATTGRKIEIPELRRHSWEIYIEDLQSLLLSLRVYANRLLETGRRRFPNTEPTLWYRGQCDAGKPLLPTLMRKEVGEKEQFHYLSQHQRHLFEQFKYMADGAPEMMSQGRYVISDYLALMQHYNSYTCLMDWTEDALSALFFAVEDYISSNNINQMKDFTPGAVYLFNPSVYNSARRKIIRKCEKHNSDQSKLYKNTVKTATYDAGLLPNLSAEYNEQPYDMFLLGNKEYETDNDYLSPDKLELREDEYGIFIPLAILTSRLNPRIRKQSGMFLAYNLYAKPSHGEEGRYDYIALEKVQDFYMKICKDTAPEPFLYKLILKNEKVKVDAASWVTAMGMTKDKVYPELNNIGENSRKK